MKLFLKRYLGLLVLGFFAASVSYAGLEPSTQAAFQKKKLPGLGAVYQIATMDGSIYIAGQPKKSGLKQLRKLKIKTFINLRADSEVPFNEKAAMKKLGIRYVSIPVDINHFNVKRIAQFNKAIYSPKGYPVFIHCATGNRAAMMMAFNSITQHKTPVDIAIDEVKHYGLTEPKLENLIKQTVKQYSLLK